MKPIEAFVLGCLACIMCLTIIDATKVVDKNIQLGLHTSEDITIDLSEIPENEDEIYEVK